MSERFITKSELIFISDTSSPSPEEQQRNEDWFDWYCDRLENHSVYVEEEEGVMHRCPCCKYKTLRNRGCYSICPVCFWEDDGQDEQDADMVRGGPNGRLSLTQARANYKEYGACKEGFRFDVRPPRTEEE